MQTALLIDPVPGDPAIAVITVQRENPTTKAMDTYTVTLLTHAQLVDLVGKLNALLA